MKFKRCFKEVSRKFKGYIKGISRNLLEGITLYSTNPSQCHEDFLVPNNGFLILCRVGVSVVVVVVLGVKL